MTKATTVKSWNNRMTKALVGKKIVSVRYMTAEEADGWSKLPLMIKLDDETIIVPLQDDEQNDGGSLEFYHPKKKLKEAGAPVMWKD